MLTFTLNYTPHINFDDKVNFVCSDNRIHFRFKDFNKEEFIVGFEKKLTYLMTYLFNYSYLPSVIPENLQADKEILLNNFLKTNDVVQIMTTINTNILSTKFKGFRASFNYKKKGDINPFGEVVKDCFPLETEDEVVLKGSLQSFLTIFRISLKDYLFNDAYTIQLSDIGDITANNKFINKELKKLSKLNSMETFVELW